MSAYSKTEQDTGVDVALLKAQVTRLEEKLRQREDTLARVIAHLREEKRAALMRMAGTMSHDISNTLVAIVGFSDLILSRLPETDPNYKSLKSIQDSGQRAMDLGRRLLDYSRRQKSTPEEFQPDEFLGSVVALAGLFMPRDTALNLQPGSPTSVVRFSPDLMRVMTVMLVENAAEMAGAGPLPRQVTVRTERFVTDQFLSGNVMLAPGNYYLIRICSTGHVATAEEQDSFCDPLTVGPCGAEDFGVGYAVALKSLKVCGGHVAMMPGGSGNGTEVQLYLPEVRNAALDQVGEGAMPGMVQGMPTILVVEDEEIVRSIIVRTLERSGFRVLTAQDGRQALEVAGKWERPADLVLTDLVMPNMDGRAFAENICHQVPYDRILFMSGYTGEQLDLRRPEVGNPHFIAKPFRPKDLIGKILSMLENQKVGESGAR